MSVYYKEGNYWVRVVGQSFGFTKNDNPELKLEIEVEQGGPTRYIRFYFSEKAAPISIRQLQELGFDKPSFRYLDPSTEGYHDFTGVEFDAYCKFEEYDGKVVERWAKSMVEEKKSIDSEAIRKLDSMFGQYLPKKKAAPAKPAAKPAQKPAESQPAAVASAADDDIPF